MGASVVVGEGFGAPAGASAGATYTTSAAACADIDPGTYVGACITEPDGSRTWLGSFKSTSGGRVFICVDYLYSSRVGAATVSTSAALVNRNGVAVPDTSVRALSEAASRYAPAGSSGDPVTDAALAYVTRAVMGDGYVGNAPLRVGTALPDTSWGLPTVIYVKAKAIWDEARAHFGPYTLTINGLPLTSQVGDTYQATVTVASSPDAPAGAAPMVGYPITASTSGGLQLVSPGPGTTLATDAAGQVNVTVKVTGPGPGTLTATAAGLPGVYASLNVPAGWHTHAAPDTVPQRGLTPAAGSATDGSATATAATTATPLAAPSLCGRG